MNNKMRRLSKSTRAENGGTLLPLNRCWPKGWGDPVPILAAVFSGWVLAFAYPKWDFSALAWVALVPLFYVLDGKRPGLAFLYSYVTGITFFGLTMGWFCNMSESAGIPPVLAVVAFILIVLYLSLYFGFFGWAIRRWPLKNPVYKILIWPALWVALEFLRDRLFSGFGWAGLGHSQYKNILLIQIADLTGVFGVSFLVMMVNVLLYLLLMHFLRCEKKAQVVSWKVRLLRPFGARNDVERDAFYGVFVCAGLVTLLILLTLIYGKMRQNVMGPRLAPLRVTLVQPNISQEIKWAPEEWEVIMKKLLALTKEAAADRPQLIIWPETSFPGMLRPSAPLFKSLQKFTAEMKIPLLFGAIRIEPENDENKYFNSAVLLSDEGKTMAIHDKLHLVPFGEFLPLRSVLPFLADILQIEDFEVGRKPTVFVLPGAESGTLEKSPAADKAERVSPLRVDYFFSVLICFEDTTAQVARRLTLQGARFLINITNDAWFLDSKEPYLHLQAAVFQAVSNRRSLVRAANTGVSCLIDPWGRIKNVLKDPAGKATYVAGYETVEVIQNNETSCYSKTGDIFAVLCFAGFPSLIIFAKKLW